MTGKILKAFLEDFLVKTFRIFQRNQHRSFRKNEFIQDLPNEFFLEISEGIPNAMSGAIPKKTLMIT